jgi:hypothetical protein
LALGLPHQIKNETNLFSAKKDFFLDKKEELVEGLIFKNLCPCFLAFWANKLDRFSLQKMVRLVKLLWINQEPTQANKI